MIIKRLFTAIPICAFAALAACKPGKKGPPSAGVPLEAPRFGDIEVRFKNAGEIAPKFSANIASKVSGRVIALFAGEGDSVRRGQGLAVIQPGRTPAERYRLSKIASPIAGTVMRYASEAKEGEGTSGSGGTAGQLSRLGDYVTGIFDSQTPTYLMTVADLKRLVVRMNVAETDILKLSEGMPVEVTVDALPRRRFPGRIGLLAPRAEKDSSGVKVFRVEVELGRGDPRLRPGMTARVEALLERKRGVLKIPLSAVFEADGRSFVWAASPGAKPRKLEVSLGLRNEMEAEVLPPAPFGGKDRLYTENPEQSN